MNLSLLSKQIMFCGGAGFVEDFVRPNVLDMLLNWQRSDGCYAPYDGSHLPDAIALHSKKSRERFISLFCIMFTFFKVFQSNFYNSLKHISCKCNIRN